MVAAEANPEPKQGCLGKVWKSARCSSFWSRDVGSSVDSTNLSACLKEFGNVVTMLQGSHLSSVHLECYFPFS